MKLYGLASHLLCAAIILLLSGCSSQPFVPKAIRIRWAHDPETLDPLRIPNQVAIEAASLLHMSLLQVDFARQKMAPSLAESLPVVQFVGDSLTLLRYRIQPAATWDDGRPVLTSDVAFTIKLFSCPGLPIELARSRFDFISAIRPDSINPRQFTLVCKGQALEFAHATGDIFIVSEAALDPNGQLRRFSVADLQRRPLSAPPDSTLQAIARRYQATDWARMPGCGPYQLVQWAKDQRLVFRRKPHWWADKVRPPSTALQARPAQLEYAIIPDAATAALALRRGDLDVYPQVPARDFARLQASATARAELNFYSTPSYDVVLAGFNTRRPALADALTRQALGRCFDAAGLLRATQMGGGQRTIGLISPIDRTNYNDSLPLLPFAPQAVPDLLRRAGWQRTASGWFRRTAAQGPPQQLQLVVRYRTEETLFATVALQFQAAAATVGIPVTLRPTESGTFSTALREGDFDVYVRMLKGNPFMFNFTPLLHSRGIGEGNTTGFHTPASDRLIEATATAASPAQRTHLLRQLQALLQQEMPLVPLFVLPNRIAASRHLKGLHVGSIKPGYSITNVERIAAPAAKQ